MTGLHPLAAACPYLAALVVLLVIVAIGSAIWAALPDARAGERHADIERQCQSLRRHADQDVTRRPRVRALGGAATHPAGADRHVHR